MSDKVMVFASFTPARDTIDEVAAILRRMRTATRQEPGNEVYDLYRAETDDGPTFHIFEVYTDQDGLQAHRDSDHYKAYRAEIPELLDIPIGVLVLSPVD